MSGTRVAAAAVLAWILPGGGHLFLGRRGRGVTFFVLVVLSLVVGCWLQGNLYSDFSGGPLSRLATLACMGIGAPYFVTRFVVGYSGDVLSVGWEYGSAFILSAGLMNLLLVLDAWDIARGVKE